VGAASHDRRSFQRRRVAAILSWLEATPTKNELSCQQSGAKRHEPLGRKPFFFDGFIKNCCLPHLNPFLNNNHIRTVSRHSSQRNNRFSTQREQKNAEAPVRIHRRGEDTMSAGHFFLDLANR
jgi:hypothetical protein